MCVRCTPVPPGVPDTADPGTCGPDTDTGWGHGKGGCARPSPCRWARPRADDTASGGHRPSPQDDLVAMVPLGFHLSNGFASALQSLGVLRSPWRPTLRPGGQRRGWVMVGGCMVVPIWALVRAEG